MMIGPIPGGGSKRFGSLRNPNQYTKIALFEFAPGSTWTKEGNAWYRTVRRVLRYTGGNWAAPVGADYRLWSVDRNSGSAPIHRASSWLQGYWDAQAGRWVCMQTMTDYLYGFQTLGPVNSASVSATIYELDGEVFGPSLGPHALYDPARWYDGADSGSRGICCLQGGRFYAVQSSCLGGL